MDKNSEPIIYAGTNKEVALRSAPKSVLAKCKELKCDNCNKPVLAVERTLADSVCLSERTGRALVVLCQECFEKQADSNEEKMAFIHLPDRDITNQLNKFKAEQN